VFRLGISTDARPGAALSDLLDHYLMPLIRDHGVIIVGAATLLESSGLPTPGESAVIAGALYAATTHDIGIVPLVAVAAAGAIIGDNIGYVLGRSIGFRVLQRYGRRVGLTDARLRLARYLFQRHGSKIVFFGRFVALLRSFSALLAGAAHMGWWRFLAYNALGGIAWASFYGFGAYFLGTAVQRLEAPLAIGLGATTVLVIGTVIYLLRREEARLQKDADAAAARGETEPI
jgi:membrane protein DedA with SNARE-associated domain